MFILSNFISAIAQILNMILTFLYWFILVRALISWVNPDPHNMIVQFLYRVTEPILYPIRRILPIGRLGIDLSPIIAVFLIFFLRSFLVASLIDLAQRIR